MARMLLDDWLEALDGEEPSYGLLSQPVEPAFVPAFVPAPVSAPVSAPSAPSAEPAGQWVRMPSGGEGFEDVFVPASAPSSAPSSASPNTEALGYAPFDWAQLGWTGGSPVVMDTREVGEAGVTTPYVSGVTPEFSSWLDNQGLTVKNYGDDSGAVGVWDLSKNGQLVDRHVDQISSLDQALNQLAPAIITAVAAPGLGQALFGGGLLGSAGAGALLGGLRAAGEGDNILEGVAKGGVAGGVGNLVSSALPGGSALATSPMDATSILQEGIEPISMPSFAPQLAISPLDAGSVLSEGISITPDVITQLMPQISPEVAQQIAEQITLAPGQITPAITPEVSYAVAEPVMQAPAGVDYSLSAPKPPGLTAPALGPGYELAQPPAFDSGSGLLGSPDLLSNLSAPISTYIPPADYTLSTPVEGLRPSAVPSNIGITAPAAGGGTLTQFGVIPDTPTLGGLLDSGAAQAGNTSTPDPYANETAKLLRQQDIAQSGTQGGGLGNMSGSAAVLPSQTVNLSPLQEAMQSLKDFGGSFNDWVKENPFLARAIFIGGGALLSSQGGNQGSPGYTYKGPMPTIKRAPFQAPTPRYLTPTPDSLLSVPRGNSNDGLLRFLGG